MSHEVNTTFYLPRVVPKARPKVTSRGTYMPKRYAEWLEEAATYIALAKDHYDGFVGVEMRFTKEGCRVDVWEIPATRRYLRGDIDNLAGGVLDAMVKGGLIEDDRQVITLKASISYERKEDA